MPNSFSDEELEEMRDKWRNAERSSRETEGAELAESKQDLAKILSRRSGAWAEMGKELQEELKEEEEVEAEELSQDEKQAKIARTLANSNNAVLAELGREKAEKEGIEL